MIRMRVNFTAALLLIAGLSACATQYGTAVGSFGQMQVATTSDLDVRIIRHGDYLKAYPQLPAAVPVGDAGLAALISDAPSGRANQGQYLYRTGRYFLSFRCGPMQRFMPITVWSTSRKVFKVACT